MDASIDNAITIADQIRYGGTQAAIQAKMLQNRQRSDLTGKQQPPVEVADVNRPIAFVPDPNLLEHNIFKLDGTSVPLVSLWNSRRVVLAFTRDFGCLFCKKMFALLAEAENKIQPQATVVIIGYGRTDAAHSIVKQTGFSGEVTYCCIFSF